MVQDLWQVHYQILLINLEERMYKIICKEFNCFREYKRAIDNSIKYKCLSCNKDYSNKPDEKLKKRKNEN